MGLHAMRVAHIDLGRGFRGGQRQAELLIRGLAAEGWAQKLVTRRGEPLAERCSGTAGLEVTAVHNNVIAAARALGGADLVHVPEGRSLQAAALNRWTRGTPYLVTRRIQKGPRNSALNRLMYGRAAAVVTVSAAISRSMTGLIPGLECIRIPGACSGFNANAERVQAIRRQAGDRFIVGHIGELDDATKGQRQIIAMAKRMRAHAAAISFLMVGSGKDAGRLMEEAGDLPNVHFAGQVNEVGDYLAAFDLFLFPSRHEGLGSILLDALAGGLPVVATAVGGIPDIIVDGVNGCLCAPDDIEALSAAVLGLFRDRSLRKRFARNNGEKARRYSAGAMTARYADLYTKLLAGLGR